MSKLGNTIALGSICLAVGTILLLAPGVANAQEQSRPFSVTSTFEGKNFTITGESMGNSTAMPKSFKINPSQSIEVKVDGKGQLQMTLPKTLIDSILVVTAGSDQIYHKQIDANSTSTTIMISIPKDVDSIKIIATRVIPEFPAALVTLAAFISAIAAYSALRIRGWSNLSQS
jgi:hypothetical protein